MNASLKQKTDLMIENFHELKKGFKWGTTLTKHFGALVHASNDKKVNLQALEEIKTYIKEMTSWNSYFRGTNEFILCNLLYMEENYKKFFTDMISVFERLITMGFKKSPYLPLAAYAIVKEVPMDQWANKIVRMRGFYNKMRENHYWLTSSDDYVLAAVLSTTELEVNATMEKVEQCYYFLSNRGFYKGNDLQALSHILAIGEESVDKKCSKAISLNTKMKALGCKLQYSGLATLGVLALVTSDEDKVIADIKEVYDYLYGTEGYGYWKLDKSTRTILASTLVSDLYVDELKKGVLQITLGNSINAIIIAQQQAAIMAACTASVAAASSASS